MNTTTRTIKNTLLAIDGMTCGHCVQAVTNALSAVPGVKIQSVAVGSAVIKTADGRAMGKAMNALDAAGYPAKVAGDAVAASAASPAKSVAGAADECVWKQMLKERWRWPRARRAQADPNVWHAPR